MVVEIVIFLYQSPLYVNNNKEVDNMYKKYLTIIILVGSILLMTFTIVKTTYSLIDEVNDNNTDNITIKEIITDNNGIYTDTFDNVIKELNIDNNEVDVIINSKELNKVLNTILNNVLDYRLNNKEKLTNKKIYNLIKEAIYNDRYINNELKEKIIKEVKIHLEDIINYFYGINL